MDDEYSQQSQSIRQALEKICEFPIDRVRILKDVEKTLLNEESLRLVAYFNVRGSKVGVASICSTEKFEADFDTVAKIFTADSIVQLKAYIKENAL